MAYLPCGIPQGAAQCFGQHSRPPAYSCSTARRNGSPSAAKRAGAGCAGCAGIHRVAHTGPAPCHQRDTTLHFNLCGYVALLWPGVRTCSPTRRYSYCAGCSTASISAATRSPAPSGLAPSAVCTARVHHYLYKAIALYKYSAGPAQATMRPSHAHEAHTPHLPALRITYSGEPVCNLCNC